MAIASNPRDFAAAPINFGPKTMRTAFYLVVGIIAMAVAIPAALMSADAGMFDECFAAADICAAQQSIGQ